MIRRAHISNFPSSVIVWLSRTSYNNLDSPKDISLTSGEDISVDLAMQPNKTRVGIILICINTCRNSYFSNLSYLFLYHKLFSYLLLGIPIIIEKYICANLQMMIFEQAPDAKLMFTFMVKDYREDEKKSSDYYIYCQQIVLFIHMHIGNEWENRGRWQDVTSGSKARSHPGKYKLLQTTICKTWGRFCFNVILVTRRMKLVIRSLELVRQSRKCFRICYYLKMLKMFLLQIISRKNWNHKSAVSNSYPDTAMDLTRRVSEVEVSVYKQGRINDPVNAVAILQQFKHQGFEDIEPFIPVETKLYSVDEVDNIYQYYVDKRWLASDKASAFVETHRMERVAFIAIIRVKRVSIEDE
uniref:LisH domain-containing protein n=1 Tax=Heterorhabditis bacteriophora TaxID=37862 RepID=A0A1I7WBU9_HETBA